MKFFDAVSRERYKDAKCIDQGELFFAERMTHRAKQICQSCPVRRECLEDWEERKTTFGVWGGLSHEDRLDIYGHYTDWVVEHYEKD